MARRLPEKPSAQTSEPFIQNHKDGSLWATGQTKDGQPTGYWEWFRRDGTRLRSGHFTAGVQTGEWTTYDKTGQVYKVTVMKPKKPAVRSSPGGAGS
ncbi:toxin-antitoxin system YwqK family antitoxin [Rariglobus hedericola]|uniref:MORN repeat variant n=1 Tax=Rariglobus hedericola TaxID=2597822 RepID=A0A556QRJ8_9BACT|nr:hypothetical protein [Rariglobus hedericola]TSJ79249.1 hypothetical protein FPL22_08140 [Rariglobus hedericola]